MQSTFHDRFAWPRGRLRLFLSLCSALGSVPFLMILVPPARATEPAHFPARLLSVVDDLDAQLHLTYYMERPIFDDRVERTLQVVAAWQRSGRTELDESLLEGWLHNAIEYSLPGRRLKLAPIPAFSAPFLPLPLSESKVNGSVDSPTQSVDAVTDTAPVPQPILLESGDFAQNLLEPARTVETAETGIDRHRPNSALLSPELHAATHASQGLHAAPASTPHPQTALFRPSMIPTIEPSTPGNLRRPVPAPVAAGSTSTEFPPADPADQSVQRVSASVQFDVNEYAARLTGHRLGIRRLEARLFELRMPTADQLASFIGELASLDSQGSLLNLYSELLSPEMQLALSPPESIDEAAAMLRAKVAQRRQALGSHDGQQRSLPSQRELTLLDQLSDRLSQFAK